MDKGPPDCEWEDIRTIGHAMGWVYHHQTNYRPYADFTRELQAEFNGLLVKGVIVRVRTYASETGEDVGKSLGSVNVLHIEVRLKKTDLKPIKSAQWAFAMDQYGRHGNIIVCAKMSDEKFSKVRTASDRKQ